MWIKAAIFVLISGTIALIAALPIQSQCPPVKVINHTNEWTLGDKRALNRAKKRCPQIYADAPCLKRFDKLANLRYTALCGN